MPACEVEGRVGQKRTGAFREIILIYGDLNASA